MTAAMRWIWKILCRSDNLKQDTSSVDEEPIPSDREKSNEALASDNPIRHAEDDTLGRTGVARSFAQEIRIHHMNPTIQPTASQT